MNEVFQKFKTKAFAVRLAKTALSGLAAGLAVSGTLLLLSSFEIIGLSPVICYLIGVAALAGAGGICYLLLYTSDKALATRLDADYKLSEKIQTMLAFREERGAIYELQREDAGRALSEIRDKSINLKRLWIYALLFAVGASVFILSLLIKPKESIPEPPPEKAFTITELQIQATEELIAYVEKSSMSSECKTDVTSAIREMLDGLKLASTETERDTVIGVAVDKILQDTDESSAALELMEELWRSGSESSRLLAKALNYYDWQKTGSLDKFQGRLDDFNNSFTHPDGSDENADPDKLLSDTALQLTGVSTSIATSLTKSGISVGDPLTQVLVKLGSANDTSSVGARLYGLSTIAEKASELGGYSAAIRELDATVATLGGDLFSALSYHAEHTGVGEYVIKRIASIYSVASPSFPRPDFSDFGESSDGGSDEGGGGGAIGSGTKYGSDDLVYDPLTKTYVEYGKILERYYSLMFGKLENGAYTDEERIAIEKYFDILYGGFKEDEN